MTKPLFLARLHGTQEQMGAQHGRLAAAEAAQLFAFYRTMPERILAGDMGAAGKLVVRTVANAWQERLARDRPPELAARTRAFVDAVIAHAPPGTVPARTARSTRNALATMDSLQNVVSLVARAQLGPFAKPSPIGARLAAFANRGAMPACSTLIAWGDATEDGELYFGRNFDFPGVGVWDAAPAFVTCVPDRGQRYGFFTTRGADTPVVTVVNEAGIVVAPHTRWHRDVTWSGAMIVDLVHDLARRAETLDDAIRIARERPISSSWGIAVGSARERSAIVLEIGGPTVDVVRPPAGARHLACTNRYRTTTLQAGELAASHAWGLHSDRREQRLRQLFDARQRPLSPQDLARCLGDRHDAAAPDTRRRFGAILAQPLNVHSVVVVPGLRRAWQGVDRAPCCEGTWAEIAWEWDGPMGGWELGAHASSGFEARELPHFVAPHDDATRAVQDAARAFEQDHDVVAARAAIDRAIAVAPADPSLRLTALWLALEAADTGSALAHAKVGLAHESDPYRRGQLLSWGLRAARAEPALVARWQDELAALDGPGLDELRAASRRTGKPHANLMMADAY